MADPLGRLMLKLILKNKYEVHIGQFSLLNNDTGRVVFAMWSLLVFKIRLNNKDKKKSVLRSSELLDQADKYHKTLLTEPETDVKFDLVIKTYTECVAYAPPKSQRLCMAYNNRSIALFDARLYNDCLKDIERAVTLDFQNMFKPSLFTRKAQCLIALGSSKSEVEKAIKDARVWLNRMYHSDPGRIHVENLLNDANQMKSVRKPRVLLDDERNMPTIVDKNRQIAGASSAIKHKYRRAFGRHFVASRDIKPGEVLIVEQPYVTLLDSKMSYSHCENCLKQTWSAIPCDQCVDVIYCSETCRQAAWNDYHDIECKVRSSLDDLGLSDDKRMSLRIAIKALKEAGSLKALKDNLDVIDSLPDANTIMGFTGNVLDGTKYSSVYTMEKNCGKLLPLQLFVLAVQTAVIVYVLAEKTDVFDHRFVRDGWFDLMSNRWAVFFGQLILRHCQFIATANSRPVTETNHFMNSPSRGHALVPLIGRINHACNPNTSNYAIGNKFAVYATGFIQKDEQIFQCYGPSYIYLAKESRQAILSERYYFSCECTACTEDWPTLHDLPSFKELHYMPKPLMNEVTNLWNIIDNKYRRQKIPQEMEQGPEIMSKLKRLIELFKYDFKYHCHEALGTYILFEKVHRLLGNRVPSLD